MSTVQIPNAVPGGIPTEKVDIPVSAVLIALFALCAISHVRIFRANKARGHHFIFSMVVFGFCMSRVTTFIVRIVWAKNPTSKGTAIAAQIFLSAGVVLLYVVNLVLCQRTMRSLHPVTGRSKPVRYAFKAYFASLIATLIMVIVTSVQYFKTTDPDILKIDLRVRKFGSIWFTIFAFSPIPITLISLLTRGQSPPTKLGTGSLRTKVAKVLVASVLLTLGAAYRTATMFLPTRPMTNPAWYHKRPAFYTFIPMMELMVVIMFLVLRFDQRFHLDKQNEEDKEREQGTDLSAVNIAPPNKTQNQEYPH